jgi:hypothetical protein
LTLYFLDTEFIEGERTVDLVSIAVVADDKREYYAIRVTSIRSGRTASAIG